MPANEEGLRALGHWLDMPAHPNHADALVIMGGDSSQRLIPGIELFKQGMAPRLWYTGGVAPEFWTENRALTMGVPHEAITHIPGTSTWEETQQIARTLEEQELDSVLIVTSWYHIRRTLCVLGQQLQGSDVQIYYVPVGYDEYDPDNWWLNEEGREAVFAEVAKFGIYWFNYGLALQSCGALGRQP
jgi:uncharacterized SAM-binding protein YcdF (DUF218 family)